MCGIVGCCGNLTMKAREVFRDLLIVCQVRGRDATGAICVDGNNNPTYAKAVGTPDVLLDMKSYDRNVDKYSAKVLIGHCRAKTVGENIPKNAHPFDHDNVIGVHNGTLTNWRALDGATGFTVDSDFLYSKISETGVEAAIPEINGAYALVFWDKNQNTLNFLRNDQRPLHFCWSEDKTMMFWASEAWMLNVVARSIKVMTFEDGTFTKTLTVDELWTLSVDKTGMLWQPSKAVEGKKTVPFHHHGSHGVSRAGGQGGSTSVVPFVQRQAKEAVDISQEAVAARRLREVLNNANGTPSDQRNTVGSSATSTTTTSDSSGSGTAVNTSTRSSRSILSLRSEISSRLLSNNSVDSSVASTSSTTKRLPLLRGLVSRRRVAGVKYITDNKTGVEYSEHDVLGHGQTCAWCKNAILDLDDVAAFITPTTVLCSDCEV